MFFGKTSRKKAHYFGSFGAVRVQHRPQPLCCTLKEFEKWYNIYVQQFIIDANHTKNNLNTCSIASNEEEKNSINICFSFFSFKIFSLQVATVWEPEPPKNGMATQRWRVKFNLPSVLQIRTFLVGF
jgi:hypothetical protein